MPIKLSYNIKSVKFPMFFCFFPRSYTVEPILMILKLYVYSSSTLDYTLCTIGFSARHSHSQAKKYSFSENTLTHDLKMIPETALKGFPLEPFFCSNFYSFNIVSLLLWHFWTLIIYHWVWCLALFLISKKIVISW